MFVSIKKDRWFRAVFRGVIDKQWSYMNTRIEDLLKEYEMEGDFRWLSSGSGVKEIYDEQQ